MKGKTKGRLLLGLGIIALTYILEFRLMQLAQVPTMPERVPTSFLPYDPILTNAIMTNLADEMHWNSSIILVNIQINVLTIRIGNVTIEIRSMGSPSP